MYNAFHRFAQLARTIAITVMMSAVGACSGTPGSPSSFNAASPELHAASRTLNVPADQAYTDTGIAVSGEDRLHFGASGKVEWRLDCTGHCLKGPNGIPTTKHLCRHLQRPGDRYGKFTAPGLACFSLIGKIRSDGTPFEVGQTLTYTVPASDSGELYLGFNDNRYVDNSGSYLVKIH